MKKILIILTIIPLFYQTLFSQQTKKDGVIVKTYIIPKSIKVDTPKRNILDTFLYQWKGKPYRYGGTSIKGIDCSGFTQKVYQDVFNINIPRTAITQYMSSFKVPKTEISIGDLLFFLSPSSPSGWHVAIYIGDNKYAHAANRKIGVVIEELTESVIKRIYAVGRYEKEIECLKEKIFR